MMKMSREEARKRVAADEILRLTEADRARLIEEWWGITASDDGWDELPTELKDELESHAEPQSSALNKKYDTLLLLALMHETYGVRNSWLEAQLERLGIQNILIEGIPEPMIPCLCCGYRTIRERGEYEICPVCFWEDDGLKDAEKVSAPNHMTLREGRENFARFGACSRDASAHVFPDAPRMYARQDPAPEGPARE